MAELSQKRSATATRHAKNYSSFTGHDLGKVCDFRKPFHMRNGEISGDLIDDAIAAFALGRVKCLVGALQELFERVFHAAEG